MKIAAMEPFFVGDVDGKPLESRYLWPAAATILDIFPDPADPARPQKVDALFDSFEEIWTQTSNIIARLLDSWLVANKHVFDVTDGEIV